MGMSHTLCNAVCTPINTQKWTTVIIMTVALSLTSISHASTYDFSHYEAILDREPFGPKPKPPSTNVVDTSASAPVEEEIYVIPPGLDKIKVTLLSRFKGIPAAGFVDGESNKPYYLLEGQEFDDFKLVAVDLSRATIKLSRGSYEAELPLWINPATTNQADVTTFGMPAGTKPSAAGTVAARSIRTAPPQTRISPEEQKRIEELKQRREEARLKRDAERKAQAEELAKLTPKEREQRLHDINTDLIINNSGPPLPITLDERDMEKLSNAGFDVPGFEKK